MVEIDHGFGIVTRYGHLEKILVNRGDEIGFRDKIGLGSGPIKGIPKAGLA